MNITVELGNPFFIQFENAEKTEKRTNKII